MSLDNTPRFFDMSDAEKRALIDHVDECAESFLVACVNFAKFCQLEMETGEGIDLLKRQTNAMLDLYHYYANAIDPISGRLIEGKNPPENKGTTNLFRR